MKISGIICEFNPLHNGHEYLIQEAKSMSDFCICLMSGNFSQRGLPCSLDKFSRAKLAVLAGADMVIELPTCFATNGADEFAFGAIKILSAIGVDEIVFGSEDGNIHNVERLANFKINETQEFKSKLKEKLKSGINYNEAYLSAMSDITSDISLQKLASSPNDILASSYVAEIKKQKSKLSYRCIKRLDNGYNANTPFNQYLSASAILELKNKNQDYKSFVPDFTYEQLEKSPVFDNDIYCSLVRYHVNQTPIENLNQIHGMNEGLEYALKKTFSESNSTQNAINSLSSKRYRKSRIQKLILHTLLGLTKQDYDNIKHSKPAVKVLAIKQDKKDILSHFAKQKDISLILSNADYDKLDQNQKISMNIDLKASDIYSICTLAPLNSDKTIGTLYL